MLELESDLQDNYSAAVKAVNGALQGLIQVHPDDQNEVLATAYENAINSYVDQSLQLETTLLGITSNPARFYTEEVVGDAENALAAAAFVDGLLAARSLLVVSFDEEPRDPFKGVRDVDVQARFQQRFGEKIAIGVELIRTRGVSDELIQAALGSGQMPEDDLLRGPSGGPGMPDRWPGARTIWEPFGIVLDRAATTLTETVQDALLDAVAGGLAGAAGVLSESPGRLFQIIDDIGLHFIKTICLKGASLCLRRLLGKLRAGARELFAEVSEAIHSVKVLAHGTFRLTFEFMLGVRKMALGVEEKFAPGGIPAANFEDMIAVAHEKDKRKWEVTHGLAQYAIPIAVASANLIALGGVPAALILVVALAGIETILLRRVLPAIVDAAG